MYIGIHVKYPKYPLFLHDFNTNWIFWAGLRKIQISNFMKICPVRAELFYAERQKWRSQESLLVILWTRLKIGLLVKLI